MLCPRGQGTSSIRLFEAMRMGIAPVIISDKWIGPKGPEWESFAVFVKEKDISRSARIRSRRTIAVGAKWDNSPALHGTNGIALMTSSTTSSTALLKSNRAAFFPNESYVCRGRLFSRAFDCAEPCLV